jgi:hypothetical protein
MNTKRQMERKFLVSRSITNQSLSNIDAKLNYDLSDDYQFTFGYQNLNKLPNDNIIYIKVVMWPTIGLKILETKINALTGTVLSPWVTASVQLSTLKDHLYFKDVATISSQQIIAPAQYGKTINYVSVKLNKEFTFVTLIIPSYIKKVDQQDNILNVPDLVTREMFISITFLRVFLQTGVTFNYFTNYFANDYNPVIGEFVQNNKQIGNFPNLIFSSTLKFKEQEFTLKQSTLIQR